MDRIAISLAGEDPTSSADHQVMVSRAGGTCLLKNLSMRMHPFDPVIEYWKKRIAGHHFHEEMVNMEGMVGTIGDPLARGIGGLIHGK